MLLRTPALAKMDTKELFAKSVSFNDKSSNAIIYLSLGSNGYPEAGTFCNFWTNSGK